jgi:phosphoribosylanthranilate isomerase
MQGRPRLKVCGITHPADVEALDGVADYLGFIVARKPSSLRVLEPSKARVLAESVSRSRRVMVVYGYPWTDTITLASKLEVFDVVQYHRPISVEEASMLADGLKEVGVGLAPVSLWDGRSLSPNPCILANAADYEYILVDADKSLQQRYQLGLRVPLEMYRYAAQCSQRAGAAGGITAENACLVAATGVHLIDVSSGVEDEPGRKNAAKVRRLLKVIEECS